ncbi:helix-turn-helix domain-containing protein [Dysgonomonas sp. Marseille-P4361]|uniref:helix-turn-helix domain-containing protein n=1 Tax=Dysgonomonas sp. Marseille-P4361 TaxID=2161820 RepID=UPI000D54E5F7|nr:helix-turn-helix domain-containing protein [Dysgonomonas sp. Marseille-P4361]
MTKYYFSLFLITFLGITSPVVSTNKDRSTADSIMNIINKSEGKEKLELLDHYSGIYQTDVYLNKELEKEAQKQNNYLYLANAYRRRIYHSATKGDRDSMKFHIKQTTKYLDLYIQEDRYKNSTKEEQKVYLTSRVMAVATRATLCIDEGKYNIALSEIQNALEDSIIGKTEHFKSQAHSLIAIAYLYTKKPTEALENFREAMNIEAEIASKKGSEEYYSGAYRYYSSMEGATIAYDQMGKYKEALAISDSLINKIENEYQLSRKLRGDNADDDFKYNFFKNRISCYKAKAYIGLKEKAKAREELDKIKPYIQKMNADKFHQDFDIYYFIEVEYYLLIGDNKRAIEYAKSITNRITLDQQPYSYLLSNLALSKALNAGGNNKEAFDLLYKTYNTNDSINAIHFSNEFAEMQTTHELKEAEFLINETNLKLKNTQMVLLIFAISFILLLLVIYIIWRNKKNLKRKNIQLYNQYKEIELRNKQITELQSAYKNITNEENQPEDTDGAIMDKLIQYLSNTKIYLDPKITREEIAQSIGTNRQYLIKAIKEKTGKTFNEFIYSYRLKYAYELIISNQNQTITDILEESGFHSKATFYNAFKEAYGMTPNELRNIIS